MIGDGSGTTRKRVDMIYSFQRDKDDSYVLEHLVARHLRHAPTIARRFGDAPRLLACLVATCAQADFAIMVRMVCVFFSALLRNHGHPFWSYSNTVSVVSLGPPCTVRRMRHELSWRLPKLPRSIFNCACFLPRFVLRPEP